MSTKFETFIKDKKIDPRRILAASAKLEKLHPEDRAIKLAQRQNRAKVAAGGEAKGGEKKKPRSGRPVTQRAIDAVLAGKVISGPQKNRILRAVNHILEQKKGQAVDLKALF